VRVPNNDFRQVGDKYGDLIQEALDNLGLEYQDVQFVSDDDPASTPVRHNGGLTMQAAASPVSQARFDWDGAAQLNPRYTFDGLRHRQRQSICSRGLPGRRGASVQSL